MKIKGWAIVIVAIASVVVLGYFLSDVILAGQQQTGGQSNMVAHKEVGTVVTQTIAPQEYVAAIGIKNTINIPPMSFVPDGMSPGYSIWYISGYLSGSTTHSCLSAGVNFPKGAKKILHVDYFFQDYNASGGSGDFSLFRSDPWTTASKSTINSFLTIYSSGVLTKYIVTPPASMKYVYDNYVYYVTICLNDYGALYGIIVYYATTL